MSRIGLEVSPLVFSKSSSNLRFRTSFLDFSASTEAANFFSRSASWVFKAPTASSTVPNLRGVFGASWSMTAFNSVSSFRRAPQQGQKTSKSIAQFYRRSRAPQPRSRREESTRGEEPRAAGAQRGAGDEVGGRGPLAEPPADGAAASLAPRGATFYGGRPTSISALGRTIAFSFFP